MFLTRILVELLTIDMQSSPEVSLRITQIQEFIMQQLWAQNYDFKRKKIDVSLKNMNRLSMKGYQVMFFHDLHPKLRSLFELYTL